MKKIAKLFVICMLLMQSSLYVDGSKRVSAEDGTGMISDDVLNSQENSTMESENGAEEEIDNQEAEKEEGEKEPNKGAGTEGAGTNETNTGVFGTGLESIAPMSASVPGYVEATDSDFSGNANGDFRYIGTDEYVEIPHTIKGATVTSYANMFNGTNVKGVKSTNEKVTDMSYMFSGSQATTLDLSSFDTISVMNMGSMFHNSHATALDLSSFDTGNVVNMSAMFEYSQAAALDLSNFDTSNVTSMALMFWGSQATSLDLSNFDTSNVVNMGSMFWGSQATTLDLSSFDTSSVANMGLIFYSSQATTLDLSSFDTSSVTNMDLMFWLSEATVGYARTQADADKFNGSSDKPSDLTFEVMDLDRYVPATDSDFSGTKNGDFRYTGTDEYVEIPHVIKDVAVTSYANMFNGTNVKGVKSTNEKVTDMSYMFYNSQATTLDLSSLDTSSVTDMSLMFDISQATMFDLSSFDTSNVMDMVAMFSRSRAITLDLSSFDTSNVVDMGWMFDSSEATTLDLSNFDTSGVMNMQAMFNNSQATVGYAGTQADADRFNGSSNKPVDLTFEIKNQDRYVPAIDSDFSGASNGDFRYIGTDEYVEIPHTIKNVAVTSYRNMFNSTNVKGVKSTNEKVTDMSSMFRASQATTLDLSSFDTSRVMNMNRMFYYSQATTLDLSSFDTSSVVNMGEMFYNSQATSLDLSNFNTSKVVDIGFMFSSSRATTLDLSSFDTSSVEDMTYMFWDSQATVGYARTQADADRFNGSSNKPVDLTFKVMDPDGYILATDSDFGGTSNGDFRYIGTNEYVEIPHTIKDVAVTSYSNMFNGKNVKGVRSTNENVTNMSSMFSGSQATTLDLSSFDTSNVTDMSFMFSRSQATTIVLSNFNTSNVMNMGYMFNFSQATTLDLSNFDTSSVADMGSMFYNSRATTLDLSSFDTSSVADISSMFTGSQATTLDLSSFDTSNVESMGSMFWGSRATVGYARTQADADRFNRSSDKPGVLSFEVRTPIIVFNGNGNSAYKKEHETSVSVDAQGHSLTQLEYQWTTSSTFPESGGWISFASGSALKIDEETGDYHLHVRATSSRGITTTETSNVFKLDNTAPTLSLSVSLGNPTNQEVVIIATATDAHSGVKRLRVADGDWEEINEITFSVSENGTYTFEVEDIAGNTTSETIEITNINKTVPTLTLLGSNTITLEIGDQYDEPGATATGDLDGDLTSSIKITGNVDTSKPGTYTVRYNVTDKAGNQAIGVTREVHVVAPKNIFSVLGGSPINVYADSIVNFKDSETSIQLPNDLPVGTTLQVKTVQNISTSGYNLAGELYEFIFIFPNGDEEYTGEYTLTLGVDETKQNAAIYYYNENNKVWEFIGGQIDDGKITATVDHFSIYGVLTKQFSGGGSGYVPSNDSQLESLTISENGEPLKLTPTFSADIFDYQLETDAAEISFALKPAHSKAKVYVEEEEITDSLQVELDEGDNVLTIVVKAEDGSEKNYTLTIHYKKADVVEPVVSFTDIAGHWAKEFIMQGARDGIIKGFPDGTFKPNQYLTRAQTASLIVRALGLKTDKIAPFSDIGGYATETQAEIEAAYHYNIIRGYPDGTFKPAEKVTRAHMALMLNRAYNQQKGMDYIVNDIAPYSDVKGYDEETVNAITMLYELGIATGSDGKYMPSHSATRAHAAKMLVNFFRELE